MRIENLILVALFSLIHFSGRSQIIYEGTHDEGFKTFQLDNGEIIYTVYDKSEQSISIYDLDHSNWKTVSIPLPKGHFLDEIKYISQNVFNADSIVELVYSCVEYGTRSEIEGSNTNYVDLRFTLNIINENGEMILKLPDSNDMKIVESNGIKKLLVYKHVGQGFNKSGQVEVYSLPDK